MKNIYLFCSTLMITLMLYLIGTLMFPKLAPEPTEFNHVSVTKTITEMDSSTIKIKWFCEVSRCLEVRKASAHKYSFGCMQTADHLYGDPFKEAFN